MENGRDPFTRIYALTKRGDFESALKLLLDQGSGAIRDDFAFDRHQAWYCIGDIRFRQSEFFAAKDAFRNALSYRREDADTLEAIGNCYDALRRPKLAERYFRRALGTGALRRDERAAISYNLANALFDQRRWSEAKELYETLSTGFGAVSKQAAKNLAAAAKRLKHPRLKGRPDVPRRAVVYPRLPLS